MKPPFPYFGGKMNLAERIAALLPEHQHYVEPYCGSLAVLLGKPRSSHETVNDADGDLMLFWRVLRDRTDDLARVCTLTPHSRAEHQASYEPAKDELERARRFWVQVTQGRAGDRSNRPGWRHYKHPVGATSMPDYLRGYVERFGPAVARLHGVSLECRDALDVIRAYGDSPDVLLYVDPPYVGSSRESSGYAIEMRSPEKHRLLGEALRATRAAVVLSGYPSQLYDVELFPDWHRHEMQASTGQGGTWANRTEVLWSNRPLRLDEALFSLGGAS